MNDTRSQPEEVRFQNPKLGAVGIEVLHLSKLRRRLAMEAARMLVHSQASVADVGHALGFS